MKINFGTELISYDGRPIEDLDESGKSVRLHLGTICARALVMVGKDEELTGQQKFDRTKVALKIHDNRDGVDLTVEEVAMIKDVTGRVFNPAVVFAIWTLLEE